jgi:outer membrane protein OmpA-like peptidoglycan-associated protein
VNPRARNAALVTCLGLGAADLFVLNFAVLPNLESGAPVAVPELRLDPMAAKAFARAASDVSVGAVSILEQKQPEPVVDALPARPEPLSIVTFRTSSHRVERRARRQLDDQLAQLAGAPSLVVVGHADPSGPEELNERLSAQRAAAVARYLREQGVDPLRIHIDFRGAREPRGDGELRRVEIFAGGAP